MPQMRVFHQQTVQALQPEDDAAHEEFCNWVTRNDQLISKLLLGMR
jgi:hypothetical protein